MEPQSSPQATGAQIMVDGAAGVERSVGRRERSKRLLLRLGLLLLTGAVINVAAAWGCAVNARLRHASDLASCDLEAVMATMSGVGRYTEEMGDDGSWRLSRSQVAPLDVAEQRLAAPGFDYCVTVFRKAGASTVFTAGWPASSLRGDGNINSAWRDPTTELLWRLHKPLWPGFAINTIFYATIVLFLSFAPFKFRRWRRIRRGLCPACAYPVGTSDKCTECGKSVALPSSTP